MPGKDHITDYQRMLRRRWRVILLMTAIVTLAVTGITLRQPSVYRAQAKMLVEQDRPEISVFPKYEMITSFDPTRHIRTQAEMLMSAPVLQRTISELGLDRKWFPGDDDAGERALSALRDQLKVEHISPANILVISYDDHDPRQAAEIVNSIAATFIQQRKSERDRNFTQALEILRSQLQANREALRKSESDLEAFKREKEIYFIGDRALDEQTMVEMHRAYSEAKTERLAKLGQLESLKKLSPEEREDALVVMMDHAHFQSLRNKLDEDIAELAVLQEKYQPQHPEILEINARIRKNRENLLKLAQGMVQGLEVEYQSSLRKEEGLGRALGIIKLEDFLKGENLLKYSQLKSQVETDRAVLLALQSRIEEETAIKSIPELGLEIIEPAVAPKFPIRPNRKMNVILGVLMGVVCGVVVAFFLEHVNQGLDSISDVKRFLNLPILSLIPRNSPLLLEKDDTAVLDPYRMLRAHIHFAAPEASCRTILLTSAGQGEGKSFTLLNLATCMAKMGDRVLVIDADFRRPALHKLLELPNDLGLVDVLAGDRSLPEAVHADAAGVANLDILTTGSDYERGIALLNSETLRKVCRGHQNGYDAILLDSPRILGVSDTFYLAEAADSTIFVVEPNHYPRRLLIQAKQQLETTGARILGVALNNVDLRDGETYYRYYVYERDDEAEA